MVLVQYHTALNFILIFIARLLLLLNKWNTEELHYYLGKTVSVMLRTFQCSRHGWDSRLLTNFKLLSPNFQHSLSLNNSSWKATKRVESFTIVLSQMKNFKVFMVHSWIELPQTRKSSSPHLNNFCMSNNNTFHKKHSWVNFSQICLKNGKQEWNHSLRKIRETILHLKSSI
jgi:hypothetical protein